ncbi:MAG: hypothetical protein K6G62_02650 [Eubacterium sp.]|nr:hypothetical protein [Eubacterium sp.]
MRKYNEDVLVITMCDLMLEGLSVKEAVDKYCKENGFVLVEYEEYADPYENDLGTFAQVKLAVIDEEQFISKAFDAEKEIKGKKYCFVLGTIDDELVEEYKEVVLKYCEQVTDTNAIGYKIARGERELTDDIVFQTAICFAKEYLKEHWKRKDWI